MPKYYSKQQKDAIREKLKTAALEGMMKHGIRHTTVDELVHKAAIPKGTFYLFYTSKEELCFEVLIEQQEAIEKDLQTAVTSSSKPLTSSDITEIIYALHKKAEAIPVLNIMTSQEVELLAKKLPPAMLEKHFRQDQQRFEKFINEINKDNPIPPEIISTAFRAIYLMTLHKKEIGEELYDQTLKLMIHGIVIQMMNEHVRF